LGRSEASFAQRSGAAEGALCTAAVPAKDRVVIPQTGPTLSGNYGPTVIRFQVIQSLGGGL
jgi:hypothetical protein